MPDQYRADLAAYYEEEARRESRLALQGRRVDLNASFVEMLATEGRTSIVDFGSGPGRDGEEFVAAGHRYVGLDLAHGNGVLALGRGLQVVHGSIDAPPFRLGTFDAGWSMSTLMHLPAAQMAVALDAMVATLRPCAPMVVSLWGTPGDDVDEFIDDDTLEGQRRLFSLRTVEQNRSIAASYATIESEQIWDVGPDRWNYQVFWLRSALPSDVVGSTS